MEEVYSIVQGVELLELDTSLPDGPLLVVVGGSHFQVGGLTKEVLLCLKNAPASSAEVCTRIQPDARNTWTNERVPEVLRSLTEKAILEVPQSPVPKQRAKSTLSSGSAGYFLFRIPLLSERTLFPITSRLAPLFHPQLVVRLLPAMLLVHLFLSWVFFHSFRVAGSSLRGWDFAMLLAGNYLGLLLHELGHTSACVRCGVSPGPIGFGLYLIFPAFYADVTTAWRLPRPLRVLVDAGGIYMSLLAATISALLYSISHRPVFAVLTAIYQTTVWISLWPFVRMDGYWAISDYLGVPNLMSANKELTIWFWGKIRGKSGKRPRVLSIEPPWLSYLYLLYYVLFVFSVCLMFSGLLSWYLPHVVKSVPRMLYAVVEQIRLAGLSWKILGSLLRILVMTVPLIGLSLSVVKTIVAITKAASRRWSQQPPNDVALSHHGDQ